MRILQVGSGDFFSTYGGGQVYVKNLVDSLIDLNINNNYDLVTISFVNGIEKPRKKDYKGTDLYEIPENVSEENLLKVIKEISPDVIHAHSHKGVVCIIGSKCNIPVVVTSHHGGLWCPAGTALDCKDRICVRKVNHKDCLSCVLRNTRTGLRYWYPFLKHLSKESYLKLGEKLKSKRFIPFITPIGSAGLHIQQKLRDWQEIVDKCTIMIGPSNKMAEEMEANGMPKEKIKVVSHGIPIPNEKPGIPDVKGGKIKFFYVGRICYVKGIHVLLEAFSKIDNSSIELHLIGGAGNKEEERYMKGLQKKYRNDSRIIWHGKISPSEIYEKTQHFHVSVSPSIFLEAFGLNIAEALALGKPVLATKSGGGEMQIKDGVNGWLVAPNNVEEFKNKIIYILNHTEVIQKLSNNCQSKSFISHIKELLEIYKEL